MLLLLPAGAFAADIPLYCCCPPPPPPSLLSLLAEANNRSGVLHYSEYYNDAVNNEDFNIREDYKRWKRDTVRGCTAGAR